MNCPRLGLIAMLVVMVTCQPHDLQAAADATTLAPPPLMQSSGPTAATDPSSPPPLVDTSVAPVATDSSAPPMATDSTMAQVATDSTMGPDSTMAPVATDSTVPPVATDSTVAPVVTDSSAAPVQSTQPIATTPDSPANYYPSLDEIIDTFRDTVKDEYYQSLSYEDKIMVLDLLSGGEVGRITEVMDSIGYERLISFIYKIPLKRFDNLMMFVLASLERERHIKEASSS